MTTRLAALHQHIQSEERNIGYLRRSLASRRAQLEQIEREIAKAVDFIERRKRKIYRLEQALISERDNGSKDENVGSR